MRLKDLTFLVAAATVLATPACKKSSPPPSPAPPPAASVPKAALEIADEAKRKAFTNHLDAAARALSGASAPEPFALENLFKSAVVAKDDPGETDRLAMLLAIGERERFERGLTDAQRVQALSQVLEAMKAADIEKLDPAIRETVRKQFGKKVNLVVTKTPEELARTSKAILVSQRAWALVPESAVRAAAAVYREVVPGATSYGALAAAWGALQEAHPSARAKKVRLTAEPKLTVPADAPRCTPSHPRWFVNDKKAYWDDPKWLELYNLKDADLPDDAVQNAVRLLSISLAPIGVIYRDGTREVPEDLAETLLVRYGERSLGCLFEALADPEKNSEAEGNPKLLVDAAKRVAQKLPVQASVRLYRAALESGWVDWEYQMPTDPAHKALLDEFKDSPYGHWFERH